MNDHEQHQEEHEFLLLDFPRITSDCPVFGRRSDWIIRRVAPRWFAKKQLESKLKLIASLTQYEKLMMAYAGINSVTRGEPV